MFTEIYASFHPFIMHFPVALLLLYIFLEFISFKKLAKVESMFYLKAVLLVLGTLSMIDAILSGFAWSKIVIAQAGGTAPEAFMQILNTLLIVSLVTFVLFFSVMIAYVVRWMGGACPVCKIAPKSLKSVLDRCKKLRKAYSDFVLQKPLLLTLLVLAFISLTVATALDSALWYGPQSDPVVYFITKLLF